MDGSIWTIIGLSEGYMKKYHGLKPNTPPIEPTKKQCPGPKRQEMSFEVVNDKGGYGYLTILEVFPHHFTGETMRRVRFEYVAESGRGVADVLCINEQQYNNLYDHKVVSS